MNKWPMSDAAGMLPANLPDNAVPQRMPHSSTAYTVKHGTLKRYDPGANPHLTTKQNKRVAKLEKRNILKQIKRIEQGNE